MVFYNNVTSLQVTVAVLVIHGQLSYDTIATTRGYIQATHQPMHW